MKGLILKDLLNLKSYTRYLLVILILFACVSAMNGDGSFFIAISSMFATVLPVTAFSYDRLSHFDGFVQCFSLSRKQIVTARYLVALGFALVSALLSVIVTGVLNVLLSQPTGIPLVYLGYIGFAIPVFLSSIILPLTYQFGVEKARVIIILVALLPAFVLMLLPRLGITMPSMEQLLFFFKLSPVILVVVLFFSYMISCTIYQRKEF